MICWSCDFAMCTCSYGTKYLIMYIDCFSKPKFQILNEALCISLHVNVLGKGINLCLLSTTMSK